MSNLGRLALASLIVTDAGAFLPAPSSRAPVERTCDRPQQPWGGSAATCRVVELAGRNGGPLCVAERQQRQHRRRHRLAEGALHAAKKGENLGGQKQKQQQGEEVEEEDAEAVEAMRLEKLAEWRAMMQSGEVGTNLYCW